MCVCVCYLIIHDWKKAKKGNAGLMTMSAFYEMIRRVGLLSFENAGKLYLHFTCVREQAIQTTLAACYITVKEY